MKYFIENFTANQHKPTQTKKRYDTAGSCGSWLKKCGVLLFAVLCASCVSQYKVVVGFSTELKDHFTEIPTIEVDIAAVTDSEADEVKQMGVEKYFDPGSGIRNRLQSQTCFFYREEQNTYVLPSRAPVWQSWMLKEPANVLVIASLPHDPSITSQADPRYLAIKMKQSFVLARTIYILVEPKKIIQITRAASKKNKSPSADSGQWVEIR